MRLLGMPQFERFRRLARDKPYDILLQHTERRVASALQVLPRRCLVSCTHAH